MDDKELADAIARFPRVDLGFFPTPLQECPRLTRFLKGPRILMKRDDCTGLAFGGNKTRHLEFGLGEALAQKADIVVAGAALQSNYCRQAAAAAARFGLRCRVVLTRAGQPSTIQGNCLLDHILGAEVELVDLPMGEPMQVHMKEVGSELRRRGFSPYVLLQRPRCEVLGALSYARAMHELKQQMNEAGITADFLYCSAVGPTQAGLIVGARALSMKIEVRGIAPIRWGYDLRADIAATANRLSELLNLQAQISTQDVPNWDEYVGERYGKPTPEGLEAIRVVARTEGVLLDPVYTGKAMAGLIDHIRKGLLPRDKTVVFLHTGGAPALFAYATELGYEQDAHSYVAPRGVSGRRSSEEGAICD